MKTFATDSAVVARARKDLVPILAQFVGAVKAVQKVARRLHKEEAQAVVADKVGDHGFSVEEWFADDLEDTCSCYFEEPIDMIETAINCDFRALIRETADGERRADERRAS